MKSLGTTGNQRLFSKRRLARDGLLLFAVWLILSGHYDLFHLVLGVFSVGLVLWIHRMDYAPRRGDPPEGAFQIGRAVLYLAWLIWEMVLSAWLVVRLVLSRRMPISPSLISFRSAQPNDVAKVLLGNSITMTPGTLTVDIQDDRFLVHALTRETAEGLLEGTMPRKVAGVFLEQPGEMVGDVQRNLRR